MNTEKGVYLITRDGDRFDAGEAVNTRGFYERYDAATHTWHKPSRRNMRIMDPIPYTAGGDYAGDDVTAANRATIDDMRGEGALFATVRGSHGYREIFARRTLHRLAARGSARAVRLIWRLERMGWITGDTACAIYEIVNALMSLENYPSLDDERASEIAQGWYADAWGSYAERDARDEIAEVLCRRDGIEPSDLDTADLPLDLGDWATLTGESDGRGTWHCEQGEGNVHMGHVEDRHLNTWLETDHGQAWARAVEALRDRAAE